MTWDSTMSALSPVGWWKFNETTGTAATDSGSLANNGLIHGSTVLGQPGPILTNTAETSYQFQQLSTEYVSMTEKSGYEFGSSTSFSYGCWLRWTGTEAFAGVFNKGAVNTGSIGWSIAIGSSGNAPRYFITDGTNAVTTTGSVINDNKFHLVVVCVDRPNTTITMYIDGSSNVSASISAVGSVTSAGQGINVGVTASIGTPFGGWVAQPFIIASLLTPTQNALLYRAARSPDGALLQLF